jgi:hypothetical protein
MVSNLWYSAGTFRQCVAEKASFVILDQLDMALTLFALSLGLTELNPWMRDLVGSPLQLLLVKFAIPLFVAWLAPGKLLLPAIALLSVVVGWNIKELLLVLL